jgi:hypothetical protein
MVAKQLLENVDFITIDISGPELLGLETFYEKDTLKKII